MSNNKVSVGITSIIGWLSAFAALSPAIVKALETGQTDFNGPEKYLAIFGIVSGLVTQVARYLQAHKLIGISTSSSATNDFEIGSPKTVIPPASSLTPDGPVFATGGAVSTSAPINPAQVIVS